MASAEPPTRNVMVRAGDASKNPVSRNSAGWVGLPDAVAMLEELDHVRIGTSGDEHETEGQGTQAQEQNTVASVASTEEEEEEEEGMRKEVQATPLRIQGTAPINDLASGKQIATLHFSSTFRELNQLSAKVCRRHLLGAPHH